MLPNRESCDQVCDSHCTHSKHFASAHRPELCKHTNIMLLFFCCWCVYYSISSNADNFVFFFCGQMTDDDAYVCYLCAPRADVYVNPIFEQLHRRTRIRFGINRGNIECWLVNVTREFVVRIRNCCTNITRPPDAQRLSIRIQISHQELIYIDRSEMQNRVVSVRVQYNMMHTVHTYR